MVVLMGKSPKPVIDTEGGFPQTLRREVPHHAHIAHQALHIVLPPFWLNTAQQAFVVFAQIATFQHFV